MSEGELALYEALLSENDHDLYAWVTGTAPAPEAYSNLIESITQAAVDKVAGLVSL